MTRHRQTGGPLGAEACVHPAEQRGRRVRCRPTARVASQVVRAMSRDISPYTSSPARTVRAGLHPNHELRHPNGAKDRLGALVACEDRAVDIGEVCLVRHHVDVVASVPPDDRQRVVDALHVEDSCIMNHEP